MRGGACHIVSYFVTGNSTLSFNTWSKLCSTPCIWILQFNSPVTLGCKVQIWRYIFKFAFLFLEVSLMQKKFWYSIFDLTFKFHCRYTKLFDSNLIYKAETSLFPHRNRKPFTLYRKEWLTKKNITEMHYPTILSTDLSLIGAAFTTTGQLLSRDSISPYATLRQQIPQITTGDLSLDD